MNRVLRAYGRVDVDFAAMKLDAAGARYLLATDNLLTGERWFVRLTQVTTRGRITRPAAEYVRALRSGRLEQEEIDQEQALLAAWRSENPSKSDEDWLHYHNLSELQARYEEAQERRAQPADDLDRAEETLLLASNTEWVRVPAGEEGWLQASYARCRQFFEQNPTLHPELKLGSLPDTPLPLRNWKPPVHADTSEVLRSWQKVLDLQNAMVELQVTRGKSRIETKELVRQFSAPWQDRRD